MNKRRGSPSYHTYLEPVLEETNVHTNSRLPLTEDEVSLQRCLEGSAHRFEVRRFMRTPIAGREFCTSFHKFITFDDDPKCLQLRHVK